MHFRNSVPTFSMWILWAIYCPWCCLPLPALDHLRILAVEFYMFTFSSKLLIWVPYDAHSAVGLLLRTSIGRGVTIYNPSWIAATWPPGILYLYMSFYSYLVPSVLFLTKIEYCTMRYSYLLKCALFWLTGSQCPIYHKPQVTHAHLRGCLLYTSPSPRDLSTSRMPSSA